MQNNRTPGANEFSTTRRARISTAVKTAFIRFHLFFFAHHGPAKISIRLFITESGRNIAQPIETVITYEHTVITKSL